MFTGLWAKGISFPFGMISGVGFIRLETYLLVPWIPILSKLKCAISLIWFSFSFLEYEEAKRSFPWSFVYSSNVYYLPSNGSTQDVPLWPFNKGVCSVKFAYRALCLALTNGWLLKQFDVNSTFLQRYFNRWGLHDATSWICSSSISTTYLQA